MARVFVTYRRDEAAMSARRVRDALAERLQRDDVVAVDGASVPPEGDAAAWVAAAIADCGALVCLIDEQWARASTAETDARRLGRADDVMRVAVEAASARKIPLIAARIDGAATPKAEDLAEGLRPLTRCRREDVGLSTLAGDIERLVRSLYAEMWITRGRRARAIECALVIALAAVLEITSLAWPSAVLETAMRPGPEAFRDPLRSGGSGPEMVVVPAGSFLMGAPEDDDPIVTYIDETPQRRVTIPAAFAVGEFEVTWDEWDACVRGGGCDPAEQERAGGDEGWGRGTRPVINVSWSDAKDYVRWLSEETGEPYRLLSEAEWEYAARAGATGVYPKRKNPADMCAVGNHADAGTSFGWSNAACSDGFGEQTAPVGSFPANRFGLYDMGGNVQEWVEDCYRRSLYGAPADGSAFTKRSCLHVLRDSSWSGHWSHLRFIAREMAVGRQNGLGVGYGFRVAKTLRAAGETAVEEDGAGPLRPAESGDGTEAAAAADAPVEVFRDRLRSGGRGPDMAPIPEGEFVMGSPPGVRRAGDEGPQRTVRIAAFAAGRFEVTWDEWDACAAAGGCQGDSLASVGGVLDQRPRPCPPDEICKSGPEAGGDHGWGRGRRPVIGVSWYEAQKYVRWLSAETGERYRLLTEAEWEYAARAGTTGEFSNNRGDAELCEIANGADSSWDSPASNPECSDGFGEQTAPAGSFAANAFGLHDMHGNVSEWVEDCYHDSYVDAPTDGSAVETPDPREPQWRLECFARVRRGGAWADEPMDLRSASRVRELPTSRYRTSGFRVARDL